MDPVKILKRSWYILWSYRALWVFGLILALAAGSASSHSSNNNNFRSEQNQGGSSQVTPQGMQEAFKEFRSKVQSLFEQGIPQTDISGKALTTFLWVIGAFILVMLVVGIVMAIARYVSETSVIRMVDEYEASGNKMTVRQGFRMGWSRQLPWRLCCLFQELVCTLPGSTARRTLLPSVQWRRSW